jgi:hypothetical protein
MAKRASPIASTPTPKASPVIRLHRPEDNAVDQDYVDAVRALLRRAECGESIGLAFIEIKSNKSYSAHTLGLAHENPTFCLGTVEVLKAKVLRRVMGS